MIEILESQNVLRRNRFSLISQMKFSELPVSHGGPESAAHGAPHRVSVQKSPAPDSISNFTTDYRTVKRHESCHMTDLKIKNFPCMWCSLFDYDHGIQELFSMLILDLFPTFAAVPKIFLISRDSQRTDLTGKIIHAWSSMDQGIVHGPSLNMSEYQVIHN